MSIAPIEEIIAAFARGEMVIMVDDADRENEGDLIVAADAATPEKLGFMLRHTSGIICLSIVGERLDELQLPMMVARNTDVRRTAFTVSIDAAEGTTTGISASRAAATSALLASTALDTTTASALRMFSGLWPMKMLAPSCCSLSVRALALRSEPCTW